MVPPRAARAPVAAVVLVVIAALFVVDAATRPAYDWPDFGKYLFDQRVSRPPATPCC